MATYIIGDIQGCYDAFQALLARIRFDQKKDKLWFVGDLVNRGKQSLEVLRFIRTLKEKAIVVLGNHDLHLIAVHYGVRKPTPTDTLNSILTAADRDELIDWLRHLPLMHYDAKTNFVVTHAGIAPMWTIEKALSLAKEVESLLSGDDVKLFLEHMYGNEPNLWDDGLQNMARARCIVNYFTRMRLCDEDGRLDLNYKGQIQNKPDNLMPWFLVPNRVNAEVNIVFGHWAALGGKVDVPNLYAIDTGCVWGNCLTALRLEDKARFTIDCA